MPEPATTTAAASITIAAAATSIPVLTILGIPLGVPPETLIAGFFGGLVGVILLNTVPPSDDGGTWPAIWTAARRMAVTFASSLTAGYVAPMFSGIIAAIPGVTQYGALLGSAFLVGAGAQRVMALAIRKFAPSPELLDAKGVQ